MNPGHLLTGLLGVIQRQGPGQGLEGLLPVAFLLLDAGDLLHKTEILRLNASRFEEGLTTFFVLIHLAIHLRQGQAGQDGGGVLALAFLQLLDDTFTRPIRLGGVTHVSYPANLVANLI